MSNYCLKVFGNNIKKAREYIGFTQIELAAIVGCHNSHICHIEKADYITSVTGGIGLDLTIRLINELGLTFEEAFKDV